ETAARDEVLLQLRSQTGRVMSGGYRLGITCPFCGGKLEIDEANRTTICSHCASVLKISRSGGVPQYYVESHLTTREVKFLIDRHLKKTGQPLVSTWHTLEQVYLPFWRVTGTVFKIECPHHEADFDIPGKASFDLDSRDPIEVKITPREVSFCAAEQQRWSLTSLGIRTQVIKLRPVDAEFQESAYLIAPSVEVTQARQRFDKSAESVAHLGYMGFSHLQMHSVGVETMMIYFPVWYVDFANSEGRQIAQFDAVAKRVVDVSLKDFELPEREAITVKDAAVEVTAHRCPNCGADLPVADSVSYYCDNCWRLYVGSPTGYRQLKVQVPVETKESDRLFPFWVFDLESSDWPEKGNFLDTLTCCQLQEERFFMPAFRIGNPARILRLVKHFNRRDYGLKFDPLPDGHYDFVNVHVTPEKAAELMMPLVKAIEAKQGYMVVKGELRQTPTLLPPELIWLPFVPDRYFLRDEITGATIEKAAVKI
ncbi:MAG: hypothetical protein ABIJ61_14770, partial [bacterium]